MHFLCLLCALICGVACTNRAVEPAPMSTGDLQRSNFGSVFGQKRLSFQHKRSSQTQISGPLNVNKFLWQAVLDTLSFMPVTTADPKKGRVMTDWYFDKNHPAKRIRVSAQIVGKELRTEALRVDVDRQALNGKKQWIQAPLAEVDRAKLEMLILERARLLKTRFMKRE